MATDESWSENRLNILKYPILLYLNHFYIWNYDYNPINLMCFKNPTEYLSVFPMFSQPEIWWKNLRLMIACQLGWPTGLLVLWGDTNHLICRCHLHFRWLVVSKIVFHFLYGMSSFPLTNSYFSRWLLHHQAVSDGLVSFDCRLRQRHLLNTI